MLQFLSQAEDDAVWERTFKAKLLNVGEWFPYKNHHSAAIKITYIQYRIIK